MRLARLHVTGFRNLEGEIGFPSALTLIGGENNTGKSNVVDALRLLSLPRAGTHFRHWITADDFAHDGSGDRITDTFILEAVYVELTDPERARMVTCLAPSIASNAARLRLEAQLGPVGRVKQTWYGGDSLQPGIESWAREAVVHTYLHPLRNAGADLRPGRDNRLVDLLSALAPDESNEREEVETVATAANAALSETTAVATARNEVAERLSKMAGQLFAQKSDLAFADPRFDRVVGTLRALAGDQAPLELSENGLGFNNLLYMATLLAAIDSRDEGDELHLLLVEEPEAHLHPQLQDLLMRFLASEAGGSTQVIATTHSPNFASASGVEGMTILTRRQRGERVVARTPAAFGLDQSSLDHLRRFLDVTKSSLLFARGVILVEGIAEQLLLPQLAQRLGISLTESGVALVNVGGVSFAPFASLFSPDRLPYRCALVSDRDPPQSQDLDAELADGEPMLSATAQKLKESENETMHVFLATRTFEWDLATEDNWPTLLEALELVKPRVSARLGHELGGATSAAQADALLAAVSDIKGRFAQALTQVLVDGREFLVPDYLADAMRWATTLDTKS